MMAKIQPSYEKPGAAQTARARQRRVQLPCGTDLYTQLLDAVMRDRRHLESAAAGDQRDWLAYLELGGRAVTTRDAYERTTAALLVAYPDVAFGEFTDSHLLQFLPLFPKKSQRIRKAHLASWFRWGRKVRRIQANPVELLPDIKRHTAKIPDLFTDGEVAILEALPLPDGPLMSLLFGVGLRKAEARHLTARRIDFPHRRVIVSEGAKGSRDRAVPMLDELASPLANLLLLEGVDPGEHLWYTRAGGAHRVIRRQNPPSNTAFQRWWDRCIAEAGVSDDRNIHATRHTFANRWRQRGLHIDDLQFLMGHASVSTTVDVYGHTSADEVADRMRELVQT